MDDDRFSLLAERHRKVLRLHYARFRLKEIARELSLSENSVNTYLTEAVQILGAPGRRAAAEALARREDPSQYSRYQSSVAETETYTGLSDIAQGSDEPAKGAGILPLRPGAGTPNKLPVHTRLIWIVALLVTLVGGVAIAVAIYTVYVEPMGKLLR